MLEIKYSKQAVKLLKKQDMPTRNRIVSTINPFEDGFIKECDLMTAVKERIIGTVSLMNDKEAENLWLLIQNHYVISPKTWNDIESVEPDEIDLRMLHEIENDPECREFVSSADAMKELEL